MSKSITNKKDSLEKSIMEIKIKQHTISMQGLPGKELEEPFKTEANHYSHLETKRLLFSTQLMVLEEIENTDKVTRRALNIAWISLGASMVALASTIIVYVSPALE